jgi:predicted RND superfamily exporter protein
MEFTKQIKEFIMSGNVDAYHEWLEQQPLILQPAIISEFIEIAKEIALEKGIVLNEEDLQGLISQNEKYEEAILDEQVAAVNLKIAQDAAEQSSKEILETIEGIKEYVKECVVTNADNAKEMKQLAQQIMEIEIKDGCFIAANWEWMNEYL